MVPDPKKCEAMMLLRGSFTGPLNAQKYVETNMVMVNYECGFNLSERGKYFE